MDANRALNFYPRPPRGGRRNRHSKFKSITRFLSTPSARRATSAEAAANRAWQISIHALREEGDNSFQCSQSSRLDFYPRPPRGGRLRHSSKLQQDKGYFYPRPPRGGRLCIPCACWLCPRFLSTPSARRATAHKCPHCAGLHISIHALREEGDLPWLSLCSAIGKFLSTPSARRATDAPLIWATSLMYFYPRPLRGGRQPSVSAPGCNYIFLSTPSARRATGESCHRGCRRDISIHALCEEGDGMHLTAFHVPAYFYPRPLRGGRPPFFISDGQPIPISIHALCEEGDPVIQRPGCVAPEFLSTPSARRATHSVFAPCLLIAISIHALCEEGDGICAVLSLMRVRFLSTPSARRATCCIIIR